MLLSTKDKRVRATITAVRGDRIRLRVEFPAEEPYLSPITAAFGAIVRVPNGELDPNADIKSVSATMTAVRADRIRMIVDYPASDPYLNRIPEAFAAILAR